MFFIKQINIIFEKLLNFSSFILNLYAVVHLKKKIKQINLVFLFMTTKKLTIKELVATLLSVDSEYSSFFIGDNSFLIVEDIPLKFYLGFSFSIFFLGIFGVVFNRKNIINLMLCIELMLFGASLNFIFFSIFFAGPSGQIFALIITTIAAADSAVGLGILIAAFYLKRNVSFEAFAYLKG